MAFFCLGKIFFSETCGPSTKKAWTNTSNCLFNYVCPCLNICFGDLKKRIDEVVEEPDILKPETFVADFFTGELKVLKARHRKKRPELIKKYSLDKTNELGKPYNPPITYGLGMEDAVLQKTLKGVAKDEWTLCWRDFSTGMKWTCPAAMNAFCCCFCCCFDDLTKVKVKIASGEAYNVTCCCGPFFVEPAAKVVPERNQVGRSGELVIVVSAPGDYHPWYPGAEQRGNVHKYFSELQEKSDGRLLFCPIQKGKKDEHGKNLVMPETKDPKDPELKDYYIAQADKHDENLELWKAYWITSVKRAIVDAKLNFDKPLNKVTFVAIYGGSTGAQLERREVAKLGKLFENRQTIESIMDDAVNSVICCMTWGLQGSCCQGCNSGIALLGMAIRRVAFCTPIKAPKLRMMVVTPNDLKDYLLDPTKNDLQDCFVSGKVPLNPAPAPEPQTMKGTA